MSEKSPWRKAGEGFRAEGIALAIPMVLVTSPIAGGLLGKFASEYFGMAWLVPVGVIAGLALGIREAIRLIKKLEKAS